MKKNHKKILYLAAGLGLSYGLFQKFKKLKTIREITEQQVVETFIPTVLLHGVYGNRHTMQGMIRRWELLGFATKILEIEVSAEGDLSVKGNWVQRNQQEYPLIQVFFDNNDASPEVQAEWLLKIMTFLKKLGIEEVNMLGHSMGGVASLRYLMQSLTYQETTPKVEKFVALGSPFKGEIANTLFSKIYHLDRNGKLDFNPSYKYFMAHRESLSPELQVLNIYGDLEDGTNSDGIVETENAKILKEIVSENVASYEEYEIKGLKGQHTLLHENEEVDQLVADFLWYKK